MPMVQWGDFEVDLSRTLGRGAMGIVHPGMQVSLSRPVAVKVMSAELFVDSTMASRFEHEARAMALLCHPNVVQVYGAGQVDDRRWFAMEFVDGEDLAAYLRRRGPLSPEEAARIGIQASRGIAAALDHGIIHRDLKPSNILRLAEGTIKVMDFGLAKLLGGASQVTNSGTIVGTPLYMSPEQGEGKEVDGRTDIYSLGVILYELLAGRRPFDAPSVASIIYKHVHEPPPRLENVAPAVSPTLARIVARCLEKDPARRYQKPGEVADALEAYLRAPATPASVGRRGWAVAAVAGVLAIGVGIAAGRWSGGEERRGPVVPVAPGLAQIPPDAPPTAIRTEAPPEAAAPGPEPPPAEASAKSVDAAPPEPTPSPAAAIAPATGDEVRGATEPKPPALEGMVYLSGGQFTMGVEGGTGDEAPPHPVRVSAFYLDTTEVTNEAYARFLADVQARGDHGRCHASEPKGKSHAPKFAKVPSLNGPMQPVVGVDWWDAYAYAAWAGKRLPTEAEWEFAARGAEGRYYPWGKLWDMKKLNSQADPADGFATTGPVGSFPAGATTEGLLDMAGNASEWCADWWAPYAPSHQQAGPAREPLADPTGPSTGLLRVVRGGSHSHAMPAAFRGVDRGQREDPAGRFTTVGFRCAKDAR